MGSASSLSPPQPPRRPLPEIPPTVAAPPSGMRGFHCRDELISDELDTDSKFVYFSNPGPVYFSDAELGFNDNDDDLNRALLAWYLSLDQATSNMVEGRDKV